MDFHTGSRYKEGADFIQTKRFVQVNVSMHWILYRDEMLSMTLVLDAALQAGTDII